MNTKTSASRSSLAVATNRWRARACAAALACCAALGPDLALAQANTETVTVTNYSEHAVQLNAAQLAELRLLARRMAQALLAGSGISATVYGHADFDARGRDFERQVSSERAESASKSLQALVAEEAAALSVPSARLASIYYGSLGLGTLTPIYGPNESMDKRRANRRIDVVWSVLP